MSSVVKEWFNERQRVHASILRDMLVEIFSKKPHGLVFKGGTALSFFYGTDRFSEDIDLYSESMDSYADIDDAIESFEKGYGYKVINDWENEIQEMSAFRRYFLTIGYGTYEDIDIQIDYSIGRCILGVEMMDLSNEYKASKIGVMKPEEILAEKVRTIYSRQKARDLYDLHYLCTTMKSRISRSLISAKFAESHALEGILYSFDTFKDKVEGLARYWNDLNGIVNNFDSLDFGIISTEVLEAFRNV